MVGNFGGSDNKGENKAELLGVALVVQAGWKLLGVDRTMTRAELKSWCFIRYAQSRGLSSQLSPAQPVCSCVHRLSKLCLPFPDPALIPIGHLDRPEAQSI